MTHTPPTPSDTASEYCSTSEAAKALGLSLGTVQQMVEEGVLAAWKTKGGHRRILKSSLERVLANRGGAAPRSGAVDGVSVLIVEDDPILQKLYKATLASWGMPLDVTIVGDGIEGLMAVGRSAPDVLITDLKMPGVDGFQMIRTLHSDPSLVGMDIIAVSGMSREEIRESGDLPVDVTIYGKPVPFPEVRGFLQAKISQKRKWAGR